MSFVFKSGGGGLDFINLDFVRFLGIFKQRAEDAFSLFTRAYVMGFVEHVFEISVVGFIEPRIIL